MRIRHVLGNAIRLVVMQHSLRASPTMGSVETTEYEGDKYSIVLITSDEFPKVLANVGSANGRVTYNVRMDSDVVGVYSKWTVENLRRAFDNADGIVAIFGQRGGTCFSFTGKFDFLRTYGVLKRLHARLHRRARDTQQEKLYKFESHILGPYIQNVCKTAKKPYDLSSQQASKIAKEISNFYGISDRVDVLFTHTRSDRRLGRAFTVTSDPLDSEVDMWRIECHTSNNRPNTFALNTVIHEMAHVVTGAEVGTKSASHGDQFTAVYIELLARMCSVEIKDLVELFLQHEIKVDHKSIYIEEEKKFYKHSKERKVRKVSVPKITVKRTRKSRKTTGM